ncbi:hypothetical protein CERZMDRAFT_112870 [Cercospora zeae-maydis SCOH1-5]|uniref:Uncharacterized protein n=1 Tax=Cercospora zeae-maydis SCOH1-5 TaxID=717836 RepID=A0A6A6FCC8_9PEZI|nr:hypothetical protein CERZMDRAFT_112870 [Cercospora zeae-maydis SCOH1-5]
MCVRRLPRFRLHEGIVRPLLLLNPFHQWTNFCTVNLRRQPASFLLVAQQPPNRRETLLLAIFCSTWSD